MSRITDRVEVGVPVRTAYDQWTQFESFPEFMEGIDRVVQLDDATLEWTATIGGQRRSWRAKIVRQVPDRLIAWAATEGARNDGVVTFEPLEPGRTSVTLEMDVEPDGPVERAGDALGVVEHRVGEDLHRFKEFIEGRGVETGAWRGTIAGGKVVDDDTASRLS